MPPWEPELPDEMPLLEPVAEPAIDEEDELTPDAEGAGPVELEPELVYELELVFELELEFEAEPVLEAELEGELSLTEKLPVRLLVAGC